jgi:hypothetical protein
MNRPTSTKPNYPPPSPQFVDLLLEAIARTFGPPPRAGPAAPAGWRAARPDLAARLERHRSAALRAYAAAAYSAGVTGDRGDASGDVGDGAPRNLGCNRCHLLDGGEFLAGVHEGVAALCLTRVAGQPPDFDPWRCRPRVAGVLALTEWAEAAQVRLSAHRVVSVGLGCVLAGCSVEGAHLAAPINHAAAPPSQTETNPKARHELCRALRPREWQHALALGRLARTLRRPGWEEAALSHYAAACRLSAEGDGGSGSGAGAQLLPLAKLHGTRFKLLAAAAAAHAAGGKAEALRVIRAVARHCFAREAAEKLPLLPAGADGGDGAAARQAPASRKGAGRRRGAASREGSADGSSGSGGGGSSRGGSAEAAAGDGADGAGVLAAVAVLEADCAAALRFCQERYSLPGQLHTVAYYLARALALRGRWREALAELSRLFRPKGQCAIGQLPPLLVGTGASKAAGKKGAAARRRAHAGGKCGRGGAAAAVGASLDGAAGPQAGEAADRRPSGSGGSEGGEGEGTAAAVSGGGDEAAAAAAERPLRRAGVGSKRGQGQQQEQALLLPGLGEGDEEAGWGREPSAVGGYGADDTVPQWLAGMRRCLLLYLKVSCFYCGSVRVGFTDKPVMT